MTDHQYRVFDTAADDLGRDLEEGTYTLAEYNERMRDLGREWRDALEEEAQSAYDDVMYRLGGYG